MARKSRRDNIISMEDYIDEKSSFSEQSVPAEVFSTAIYARLSVENNGYENDVSIESQVAYVHKYILDHPEYELFDTYIDNGVSGTSFERPGFKKLLEDIRQGLINCIIVKDLSRFGRNYIETGLYIENIFPKLGVKLVAINDNFDSSREEDRNSLSVPIKNMINEMYARDQSRKMLLANGARKYDRKAKSRGNDPYGYKYDYELGKYVPDERYAPYVRLIFLWMLIGTPANEVARRLTAMGAPLPGNVTGDKTENGFGTKWKTSKIYNIVRNPVYTGDTVRGRFERRSFGRESVEVSADKWVIHSDTHEPLVPREDYWKIKNMIADRDESRKRGRKMDIRGKSRCMDDFNGLVYCGDCNRPMLFNRFSCENADGKYTNKEYVCCPKENWDISCGKKVSADYLSIIVNEQLSNHIEIMCDQAAAIKEFKKYDDISDMKLTIDSEIKSLTIRIKDNKARALKLYEDYISGTIDINEYRQLKNRYSVKDMENKLECLKNKKNEQLRKLDSFLELFDDIKEKLSDGNIGSELYERLVDKIIIYGDDRIEIHFKFDEEYGGLNEYCDISQSL